MGRQINLRIEKYFFGASAGKLRDRVWFCQVFRTEKLTKFQVGLCYPHGRSKKSK